MCAKNGIVIDKSKFPVYQDNVEFAGLVIAPDGISPSLKILAAIKDFPVPKDSNGARSWFDSVNPIAWAYPSAPLCSHSEI